MIRLAVALFLAVVSVASGGTLTPAPVPRPGRQMGEAKPLILNGNREVYGSLPKLRNAIPVADLLREPEKWVDKTVQLRGTVAALCQKRGCWLTLRDGSHEVHVRFRDYKFFVPLDITGRRVVIEGTPQIEVVSEATRRHLAEDAGRPPAEVAAISGDERAVQMVADSVEVLRRR